MPRSAETDPMAKCGRIDAFFDASSEALRHWHAVTCPAAVARFVGATPEEVENQLAAHIAELEMAASLQMIAALEATFRNDFKCRPKRSKDQLGKAFKDIKKERGDRVAWEQDILEAWKAHSNVSSKVIGDLKDLIRYRNWLAHGCHWRPNLGRTYEFRFVSLLTNQVLADFPFSQ